MALPSRIVTTPPVMSSAPPLPRATELRILLESLIVKWPSLIDTVPPKLSAVEFTMRLPLPSVTLPSAAAMKMVPPLAKEWPLARVSEYKLNLPAPCTSKMRDRSWASMVAPSPSDASNRSIESMTIGAPPSSNTVPGGMNSDMVLRPGVVLAIRARSCSVVATVENPMGPGMRGGKGGETGGVGETGGAGDGMQPRTTTPAATHVAGHSAAICASLAAGGVKGRGQPAANPAVA
eukprot:3428765-Prymnesium_polylepis.3